MSFETDFDNAFTILLGKAQGTLAVATPIPTPVPVPGGGGGTSTRTDGVTVNFGWGGGGSPITLATADPILAEIPFACELVWAHLYAGSAQGQPVPVTATLDVQLTQWATFGSGTPLHGDGTRPRIQADSLANMSLTGWQTRLAAGETLIARLLTFTGNATFLTLNLMLRPTEVTLGQLGITVDSDVVVDADGNELVVRS